MKSIAEILGDYQMVFGISFDVQEVIEGILTYEHRAFIKILQVIEEFLPAYEARRISLDAKAMKRLA